MGKYTVSDEELQDCLKQIKAILHIKDDEPDFLGELKEAVQDVLNDTLASRLRNGSVRS